MNQEIAEALVTWGGEVGVEFEFFEHVTPEQIIDQGRWSTYYAQVWHDTRDDTYWELTWGRGSTEYQDGGPEGVSFTQVVPKQVMVTKYVPVGED